MPSLEAQLTELKALRDKELISESVYLERQKEILDAVPESADSGARKPIRQILSEHNQIEVKQDGLLSAEDLDKLAIKLSGIQPEVYRVLDHVHKAWLRSSPKAHTGRKMQLSSDYEYVVVALALALRECACEFLEMADTEAGCLVIVQLPRVVLLNEFFAKTREGRLGFRVIDGGEGGVEILGESQVAVSRLLKHDFGLGDYFLGRVFDAVKGALDRKANDSRRLLQAEPGMSAARVIGPVGIMLSMGLTWIAYFLFFAVALGLFFLVLGQSDVPAGAALVRMAIFLGLGFALLAIKRRYFSR